MRLEVIAGEARHLLEVAPEMLEEAEAFFARMDADMDGGWQLGPVWVERPDTVQRCQIAADRLLGAIDGGNESMTLLMAGYIVSRLPGTAGVRIDIGGDPAATEFLPG